MKVVNRKAYRDYEVLETYDAGVVLSGAEAKAVRGGRLQLGQAHVRLRGGEAWLINAVIPRYEHSAAELDESRTRKLLLTKKELLRLEQKVQTKGVTLVPLAMYTKRKLVKVTVGLVKGRKEFEKREVKKQRDWEREVEREIKQAV